MTNDIKTYNINVTHLDHLDEELAKLNKKAAKLGCQQAVLVNHGEFTKTFKQANVEFSYTVTYRIISVTGETPKLAGWKLLASIERQESGENLISCVPGETVPVEYRTTDTHCDHCHSDRRRKEVFVLKHDDGHHVQIGRNCLSDFLGGKSPEGILAMAAWCFDLDRLCSEAEDEGWGSGGRTETAFNLDEFLKMTAAVIRRLGWVSRTTANKFEDNGPQATVSTVTWLLSPAYNTQDRAAKADFIAENKIVLEERDAKLATDALAWGVALPVDDGDYLYNLGVGCRLGFVRFKTAGIVASLIAAYQRHLEREEELNIKKQADAQKVRVHLGVIDERQGFAQVTVKGTRSFETDFGTKIMIRFETPEGSVLVWFKSGGTDLELGQTLDITGTVKKHEVYNDIPQTIIQRVTEGLPKVKKSKKKDAA